MEPDIPRRVPIVSCVLGNSIVELVYDPEKRKTGFIVSQDTGSWRSAEELTTETGQILVPYSPHNNLIAHGCVLFASKPESYGSKPELVAAIRAFLHRYVDLSPLFEDIAAHYVLLSWVHTAFSEVPYLRLRGEYGTGKTRGLLAIGALCYKAFFAAGASTTSPIFHTLDRFGGTLVLDEADFRFSDATADLVKILNNGTVKGLPVLRTIQNRNKEFNPAAFHVFGPKIIAMRGRFEDPALESRFLTEETGLRPLRSDIPLSLPRAFHAEAQGLRNRLLRYRLDEARNIHASPAFADTMLDPRINQITLPLLALMDDAELRDRVQASLRERQRDERLRISQSPEAQILKAALRAISQASTATIPVQSVADLVNQEAGGGEMVSARRVGAVLKSRFGVSTRKSHGVFVLQSGEQANLSRFAARYGLAA